MHVGELVYIGYWSYTVTYDKGTPKVFSYSYQSHEAAKQAHENSVAFAKQVNSGLVGLL